MIRVGVIITTKGYFFGSCIAIPQAPDFFLPRSRQLDPAKGEPVSLRPPALPLLSGERT